MVAKRTVKDRMREIKRKGLVVGAEVTISKATRSEIANVNSRLYVGRTATINEIDEKDGTIRVRGTDFLHWYTPACLDLTTPKSPKDIYQAMQDKWVKLTGVKVGSRVRVTRKVTEYHEGGWDNGWVGSMSDYVGEETTIRSISTDSTGIVLNCDGYDYPYFVLEPVEEVKEVIVECECYNLHGKEFKVVVSKDGNIKIDGSRVRKPKEFISTITKIVKLDKDTESAIFLREGGALMSVSEMGEILEAYKKVTTK